MSTDLEKPKLMRQTASPPEPRRSKRLRKKTRHYMQEVLQQGKVRDMFLAEDDPPCGQDDDVVSDEDETDDSEGSLRDFVVD